MACIKPDLCVVGYVYQRTYISCSTSCGRTCQKALVATCIEAARARLFQWCDFPTTPYVCVHARRMCSKSNRSSLCEGGVHKRVQQMLWDVLLRCCAHSVIQHLPDFRNWNASLPPICPHLVAPSVSGKFGAGTMHSVVPTSAIFSKMRHQRTFRGHSAAVYALALDPLMRYVVTGSDDYMIKIWSMVTGVVLAACRGHTVRTCDA